MHRFPIIGRNHFNRIPWTAIQKRAVRSLADTFLTTNAEVRIDFDSSKRRMIFVGHPEHASFDRAVLNTGRRAGATSAAVSGDGEYPRPFLARRLTIAF